MSSVPRFLAGFIVSAAIGAGMYGAASWLSAGVIDYRTAGMAAWTADLVKQKLELLERTPKPRMLLFGGSNVLFGLNAADMSRRLGRRVVNLASNAGLEWPIFRIAVFQHLEPGDTLVLPLEVDYFGSARPLGTLTVESAHSLGAEFFWSLSVRDRLRYVRLLSPAFLFRQLRYRMAGDGQRPRVGYWGFPITATGDLDLPPDLGAAPERLDADLKTVPTFVEPGTAAAAVCGDIARLAARGVRVIVTSPNIFVEERHHADYDAFQRRIAGFVPGCGARFLTVRDYGRQPFVRLYDSRYHLTPAGRDARVEEFVEALCAYEGDCTDTAESRVDR